jgi:tetratricopeptide (TPR) repeat protein
MLLRAAWGLALLSVASCATAPPAPTPLPPPPVAWKEAPPLPPDPFRTYPETIRLRARECETRGELRKALFLWSVVLRFVPRDAEAAGKARALSDGLRSAAEAHFRKGVERFRAGATAAARREFLLALANDPSHAGALDYIRHRLAEPDLMTYETRAGDTLRRIAKKVFDDPAKDGMIAYFNDLEPNATLRPGTVLTFPVPEAIPFVEPQGKEPKDILSYPKEVDREEADRLYREGLRRFQAGDFEQAAADWKKAVQIFPGHVKARKDLERVRRMMEKLK